jgi:catechol 2,3-dioxygenase-like lactoylglutathione lyase family enzyme
MTIHHVALETRPADLAACVEFWALLGYRPVEAPPSLRDRATWVERDGRQVHFMRSDDPVVPPNGHVALVEPGLDALVERLRAAGVEVRERQQHWGARRVFVDDPAGHVVELMAAPPA